MMPHAPAGCSRARVSWPASQGVRHMNVEAFDAIVVGAGQAGPSIAERCAKEGLRTADGRAPPVRRHLRERGLHADQGLGGKRAGDPPGAARRRVRLLDRRGAGRHGAHQGAQGQARRQVARWRRGKPAQARRRGGDHRPCPLRRTRHARGGWAPHQRAEDLPRCRLARVASRPAGHRRGGDARQRLDPRTRPGARAPGRSSAAATSDSSSRRCSAASAPRSR